MSEFQYLKRPRSKEGDRWREASLYHLIGKDGKTSVCGAAVDGQFGFEAVVRQTTALRSMTCSNCRQGRVVSK